MKMRIKTTDIAWRVIEGQAFIINTKTSTLHELDETGTFIWKLIEKGASAEGAAAELAANFNVTLDTASKDTEEFLSELEKKGILVR